MRNAKQDSEKHRDPDRADREQGRTHSLLSPHSSARGHRWRIFRERWPLLPWHWKVAIIGLGLISVFETIRTAINLIQGEYW